MWSQLVLCCLIGFAAASDHGWKTNTEYIYKVHGRTLTGMHDVANQYSGIVVKANMIIRPQSDGILMAKISDAKYAQIHANLPEGYMSQIPDNQANYKQLHLTESPFEIQLKNGIVRDLIVSKDVPNWEANLLKSFVSQIQLDTHGENAVKSHVNQLPEGDSNSANFKTMEDTVTGKYETMYDITPLPEYVLQSEPWLIPVPQMKGDGEFIEIVKTKNFSRGEERIGYHHGLGGNGIWEPSSNQMGEFFVRSSIGRTVISGNLKRYTIQSAFTSNKIILSPTLNSEQKGLVVSNLNLTLSHVQPASSQFQKISQPKHLGSLIYSYNSPFDGSQEAKQSKQSRQQNSEFDFSSEEQEHQRRHYRHRRSANSGESDEQGSPEHEDSWTQDEPKLNEAPQSPLLPAFIAYKGQSIKNANSVNIVPAIAKIAQQIGNELQRPENIPKEATLSKFDFMIRLVRLLNESEMKQLSQKLHSQDQQNKSQLDAWKAFRDAVAQAGTGPALLTIQDWIKNKQIKHEEAAQVLSSMAQSVRQPTQEYMRTFYSLATSEEVRTQHILNDTAILSFTNLVRKVYVDKEHSHNQYPVQSFGSFRKSNNAKQFVTEEVIPYLKQKLNHAVEEGDSHKTLVYIRAIGNVAHQKILAAFEPYLEGKKQVSQFQRFQMVLAMNRFVEIHPKIARSVLYKIYQNAGEQSEVRVAAVYQLMRTVPPASMLQRMAQYTKIDADEQVNAAVKSAIESACEYPTWSEELAQNARSAEPLLTNDNYGMHYSFNNLRTYVVDEMNMLYKHNVQSYGSYDSIFPRGLKYVLHAELGSFDGHIVTLEGMVSSIDELTNVLAYQTEMHQHKQQQHKQNFQQAQQNKFSSENIARLLKIETEEREQLEGSLKWQLGGGATRFFTFNNETIKMLPEVVREIEECLREGKDIHYSKLWQRRDITISFPTEMSLPFIYTLSAPTLVHVEGHISATAEPKISSGNKIHKPHTISGKVDIKAVLSTKLQAKLGFVAPFEHQKYVSGVEKNMQVYLPLKSQIELDIKNKQMQIQLEPSVKKNTKIAHYSSWPFTARRDMLNMEPWTETQNRQIIYAEQSPKTEIHEVVGKQTGMAFQVDYVSEQSFLDSYWMYDQLSRHDIISAAMAPFVDETIQYAKLDLEFLAEESTANKAQIRMGYENRYESDESNDSNNDNADVKQLSKLPQEPKERRQQIAKMTASGIKNANVRVYDASIEFDGENKVKYIASAALASGSVDQKSRAMFHLKKQSANPQKCKPFEVAMSAKARVPQTNGLDFVYALKFDPTTNAQVELVFGEDLQSATKINLKAELEKSESRKRYLQSHPRAQECREEMQEGNKQMPACANMTAEANLMDRVHLNFHFENVSPRVQNMTNKLYNKLRYLGFYNLDENLVNPHGSGNKNQFDVEARFEPDFESVNVTIRSDKMQSHFDNIRVNDWAKQVVAVHPVFPAKSRVMGKLMELDTYRPICVVDKTAANTLDNKTYPIELEQSWTVMFQYVPTFARRNGQIRQYKEQQEQLQTEQFAVLVRDAKSGKDQKEVKLTLRAPETQGQLIEIDMTPSQEGSPSGSQPCAHITVNNKQEQYNDKKSTDVEGGYIKIYALPNGEAKLEVGNSFYIIYDGERVKLTVTHDKFRDSVRGLCGTFSGEEADDFLTPANCVLRNPREFAATYAIEPQGKVSEYKNRAQKSDCYEIETVYANVISDFDAGRNHQKFNHGQHSSSGRRQSSDSCTKHQTRYSVEENGDICFTVRPIAVCKSSCNASNYIKKSVPVHCVQNSSVAQLWKKQIEKGVSPDFSLKTPNKTLKMEVPESCSKY